MLNISFSDGIGVLGLVLAIILVVLDKAGKVKGGFVFVLLFVAAVMTLFLALGNSWVTEAPPRWRLWRGALLFSLVTFAYTGVAIWIDPGTANEARNTERRPAPAISPMPSVSPTPAPNLSERHANPPTTPTETPHKALVRHDSPKEFKPEQSQPTPTPAPKFQQNVVGDNNTAIQAEQINIGITTRLLPPDKYAEFVEEMKVLPKGTAVLVLHKPITEEMNQFGGQLQSAFKDAGWSLPGYATDISNLHIVIQSGSGPNDTHRNTPEGLHCVTDDSALGMQVFNAMNAAGIKCELSS